MEVAALQYPGRDSRTSEPARRSLVRLAGELAESIVDAAAQARGRFAFFGHSVGALVAFETARAIRRRGGPSPVWLFASGRGAPSIPDPRPPLHILPRAALIEELHRRYGNSIPMEVLAEPELLDLLLPILEADLAMHETYEYQGEDALDCPITVLGGESDDDADDAGLEAWRHETSGLFRRSMFPGGHFFLRTHGPLVLKALSADLSRVGVPAPA